MLFDLQDLVVLDSLIHVDAEEGVQALHVELGGHVAVVRAGVPLGDDDVHVVNRGPRHDVAAVRLRPVLGILRPEPGAVLGNRRHGHVVPVLLKRVGDAYLDGQLLLVEHHEHPVAVDVAQVHLAGLDTVRQNWGSDVAPLLVGVGFGVVVELPLAAIRNVLRLKARKENLFLAGEGTRHHVHVAVRALLPGDQVAEASRNVIRWGFGNRLPGLAVVSGLPDLRVEHVTDALVPHALHVQGAVEVDHIRRDKRQVVGVVVRHQAFHSASVVQGADDFNKTVVVHLRHNTNRAQPFVLGALDGFAEGVAEDHGKLLAVVQRRHRTQVAVLKPDVLRILAQHIVHHLHDCAVGHGHRVGRALLRWFREGVGLVRRR